MPALGLSLGIATAPCRRVAKGGVDRNNAMMLLQVHNECRAFTGAWIETSVVALPSFSSPIHLPTERHWR